MELEGNKRKKVLIVEDNDDILEMMATYLRLDGFETVLARDGLEAVEMAGLHCPDLILMDIAMPRMNGLEAARIIKESASCANIPIIALTAHHEVLACEDGSRFADVVRKPLRLDVLKSAISAHLNA